jgi:hypothetical protein
MNYRIAGLRVEALSCGGLFKHNEPEEQGGKLDLSPSGAAARG